MMDYLLAISILAFLIRVSVSGSGRGRAQCSGGRLYFPPGRGIRIHLGLNGMGALYIAYRLLVDPETSGEWHLPALSLGFAVWMVFIRPAELSTDESGIRSSYLFGLKRKRIRWRGASARFSPSLGEILVVGADGTTITHTEHHVGRTEFLYQLEKHGVWVQ